MSTLQSGGIVMKKLLLTIFAPLLVSLSAQAADVVCSCQGEEKCSDITISILDTNPGVYMTVDYAYGERNLEGFATITSDSKTSQTIYHIGSFTIVEKDNKFTLPGRPAKCS